MGAKGRFGARNCSSTPVLTALTTIGRYNVRAAVVVVGSWQNTFFVYRILYLICMQINIPKA
jgi:hypothetical protein